MKLVEDPMFCHSTFVHGPDPKPFQHNDNTLVDAGPKDGNNILRVELTQNLFGLKGYEKETDTLPFELNYGDRLWRTPDLHCYISVDGLGNGNKSEVRDSVVPFTMSSGKIKLLEDTDLYPDKSFTECELPELIVCYKENYNVDVKDICVDEGVPSMDKIMVDNGKEEPVGFFTSFSPDKDKDSDFTKEKRNIGLPVLDELKDLEENSSSNDIFKHSDTEDTENRDLTKEKVDIGLPVLDELKALEENSSNDDIFKHSDMEDTENSDMTKEKVDIELPVLDELKVLDENSSNNYDDSEDTENSDFTKEKVNIELSVLGDVKSLEVNACNNDTFNDDESEDASNIDLIKEIDYNEFPVQVELKSSAEDARSNRDESDTEDLIQDGETRNGAKDEIETDVSKEKSVPENRLLEQDLGLRNSICKSSEIDGHDVEQQSIQMSSGDRISTQPSPDSVAEESNYSSIVDVLSYNSKVESGSITFHFDSSTPAACGNSEGPQNVDRETHLECPNAFMHEDVTSDHLNVSSHVQRDHGESSFASFSGLINQLGPIAYSGSLSIRSDSSTTSTRSFAFPVLQTEWSSSPVRMGKSDRRHFQKHRGWRQGLLCCRF